MSRQVVTRQGSNIHTSTQIDLPFGYSSVLFYSSSEWGYFFFVSFPLELPPLLLKKNVALSFPSLPISVDTNTRLRRSGSEEAQR